ncbi:MAG: LPXTG cell wall anchor domain-containing protein [Acidimicrobiales bacterium]
MIRKLCASSLLMFSLFAGTAVADEEEYPPKDDGDETEKEVTVKAKGEALADTGGDAGPMVMVASGLIVAGGVMVVSMRRKGEESLVSAS